MQYPSNETTGDIKSLLDVVQAWDRALSDLCYDLMTANGLAHECVLVSANESEFERVPGLTVVNWQRY